MPEPVRMVTVTMTEGTIEAGLVVYASDHDAGMWGEERDDDRDGVP